MDPEVRDSLLRAHKAVQVQIDDEIAARDACDRLGGKLTSCRILCKLLKGNSYPADNGGRTEASAKSSTRPDPGSTAAR